MDLQHFDDASLNNSVVTAARAPAQAKFSRASASLGSVANTASQVNFLNVHNYLCSILHDFADVNCDYMTLSILAWNLQDCIDINSDST